MKRHLAYFKYIIRHKWFVFVASLRIGGSLWLAIIHDLSKFRLSEWLAYAYTFYETDGTSRYVETPAFNRSWLYHQHRNPHHWQYWILRLDDGKITALPMPLDYIYEMVADWMGAGRAITGKWQAYDWYVKNKYKIMLHEETEKIVKFIFKCQKKEVNACGR